MGRPSSTLVRALQPDLIVRRSFLMRTMRRILEAVPTMEGAGVRLKRVFGHRELPMLDPFLLLDNFGSNDPGDYVKGFPWHPHRGIETVTYMIEGEVEHGDSLGNRGRIGPGDVQWMTAGSGIIHQEMPQPYNGTMRGFQLWVNLPAKDKMMPPRYQEVKASQIPIIKDKGISVKVISGVLADTKGPVSDLVVPVEYMDVTLSPGAVFKRSTETNWTAFFHVFEGICSVGGVAIKSGQCAVLMEGDIVEIASDRGGRFLYVAGRPLDEPVEWGGPIVMNSKAELEKAFEELRNGKFIKNDGNIGVNQGFYRA